jgi:lysophospholipase L1-like esterase
MPAINITDLNNAKTDVDHIAAIATSTAPTATDRLGNVKKTMAGASADVVAKIAEVEAAKSDAVLNAIPARVQVVEDLKNTAVITTIPTAVAAVESAKNVAVSTTIPAKVAEVEAAKNTAVNTTIPAAVATVTAMVEDAIDEATGPIGQSVAAADASATSAADSAAAASLSEVAAETSETNAGANAAIVAAISGVTAMYATVAEMTAAVAGIATSAFVGVLQDENNQGQSSIYRKVAGVMEYQQYLSYPRKFAAGVSALRAYPRGSVFAHVGDSLSVKSGEWGVGYLNGWNAAGGVFEGWTHYNMASNGSPASSWAAQIAAGNTAEAPADYANNLGYNPWAVVNADPDVIGFQLGTNDLRMDGSANAVTTLRANIAKLITLFLARTSAHIIMQVPPPIVYLNPDTYGFTNCTSAADAAARSAALRTLYLEYENVSSRITVVDLQKHLYGFSAVGVAASQDPEGQGALMKDTLHLTNLGQTRRAQIIARTIDPTLPYTTAVTAIPIQSVYKDSLLSTLVNVKASGAGYVDIYADTITQLLGSLTRGWPRGPLNNIRRSELMLMAGTASKLRELLQGSQILLYYPATATSVTLSNFTAAYNLVDGVNDYWRVSATGTFAGSGPALAYVTDATKLARRIPDNLSMQIQICGALPLTSGAAAGAAPVPLSDTKPVFNATTMSGVRQAASGTATVDLYVTNVWNKSYSGSVAAAAPGYKLGTLSFANGFFQSPTWAADPTNFPGGTATLPDTPSNLTVLHAILSSGSMGDYGVVTIRCR